MRGCISQAVDKLEQRLARRGWGKRTSLSTRKVAALFRREVTSMTRNPADVAGGCVMESKPVQHVEFQKFQNSKIPKF